jgi:outer membrane protein assembly factor BamB
VAVAAAYDGSVALDESNGIYIGFWDSTFYALDLTGAVRWKYRTDQGFSANPVIGDDGKIYAATDTVFCFDPNGSVLWRFAATETTKRCVGIALGERMIFCRYDDYGIITLGYDGQKRWAYTPISFSFHGTILIDEDENIYFRVDRSVLASVDRFGQSRWFLGTSPPGFGTSEPVLRGDRIYSATLGNLFSTDKETGGDSQLLGGVPRPIAIDSSPLIADDGRVIVATQYEGTSPPLLACIGQDSTIHWQVPIPGAEYTDFQAYLALSRSGEIILATFSIESSAVNRVYKFK